MFRTFLTLALSMLLLADANATTTPAQSKNAKTAKASARTSRRMARKAHRTAAKAGVAAPVTNDGWPPIEEAPTAVAVATPAANEGWAAGAPASNRGEIDNANVYASPGMPLHVRTSNGMVPYSVRPPRKPAASQATTLGN